MSEQQFIQADCLSSTDKVVTIVLLCFSLFAFLSSSEARAASSGATLQLEPGNNSDIARPFGSEGSLAPAVKILAPIGPVTGHVVRVAYIIPSNRSPQSNAVSNLAHTLTIYQSWYRDQMVRNGFAPKTFRFETEADGVSPFIHVVEVTETD